MFWAVLKDGVCIAKVVWDGKAEYRYPFPHDELVHDPDNVIPVVDISAAPSSSLIADGAAEALDEGLLGGFAVPIPRGDA